MGFDKKTLIKLVQLPIPEVHHLYAEGNIPLAAGYLKAAVLREKKVAGDLEIEIIPRDLANFGGDTAILKWLRQGNTSMVGFTCYMWNIERNIYLARKLKEQNPGLIIVFGGPEIDAKHWTRHDKYIDTFIIGEGELVFLDVIKDIKTGHKPKPLYQSKTPVNLGDTSNPYLEKILVPVQKESMYLETMRGCPYPCKYCFYSKAFAGLRFFPTENLSKLFNLARDYHVPEIYLMDPSFNVAPNLETRLELIRDLNTTGIPVHSEIRLEAVTPQIALMMKAAGFRSVEAGLQSVNEKALAAIGRTWNREKFINGARLLQEQQIDVKTGIILGLPYDTPDDFERTLDFVLDLNLEESLEIYPLSLIPGTQLRDEAESLDITYMQHPPYWTLSTTYMKEKDMKTAVEMVNDKLNIEFFPPIIPRFVNFHPAYTHFLDLRDQAKAMHLLNDLYRQPERLGHSLTVLMSKTTDMSELVKLGRWLGEVSPFTLVQLIMDRKIPPPLKNIRCLVGAFFRHAHYFNHIHHYKIDSQGTYSFRLFHLTDNPAMAELYRVQPQYCDLVLRYTPQLLEKARDILEEKPILWVESPISETEAAELKKIYEGFEDFLINSPF
ncbi:MAG TPA: B12-binding domain-containing radical SAM protein [Candidatus Deferrimicrobium sp.]|nr:B12-binding domain-containing radical SAM protein [Candidatus Deferrimicrobium sp.]